MTPTFLTAALPEGPRHGFFTRAGGVSDGLFASLNCGPGSDDDPQAVATNRARAAEALGADPAALLTLHQIHSAEVVTITEPFSERPRADALVTGRPGLALGVLSADCAPVLLADAAEGVIGAAHAGWRGALSGVLEATVAAMRILGARSIQAAIGPCISQRVYEVGPDFLDAFRAEDPDHTRFFAGGAGDRLLFDLPGFCLSRLRAAGVEASWTGQCTYSDEARFFSYRRATHRAEPDYGRLLSAIMLPG